MGEAKYIIRLGILINLLIIFGNVYPSNDNDTSSYDKANRKTLNIISLNAFDLLFTNITLNYERLTGQKRQFGVICGFSVGTKKVKEEYDFNNVFAGNVGLNYYPRGFGKWSYFTGISLLSGIAEYSDYYYLEMHIPDYVKVHNSFYYMKFFVNNGVKYSIPARYYFSLVLGLGVRYYDKAISGGIRPSVNFMINFGVPF